MIKVYKPTVGGFKRVDSFRAPTKSTIWSNHLTMNRMIRMINACGHLTRRQFGMYKSGSLKLS